MHCKYQYTLILDYTLFQFRLSFNPCVHALRLYLYATPNPPTAGAPAQWPGQCKRPKRSCFFSQSPGQCVSRVPTMHRCISEASIAQALTDWQMGKLKALRLEAHSVPARAGKLCKMSVADGLPRQTPGQCIIQAGLIRRCMLFAVSLAGAVCIFTLTDWHTV